MSSEWLRQTPRAGFNGRASGAAAQAWGTKWRGGMERTLNHRRKGVKI